MNLEQAKEIFDQIIELCYQINSPRLNEIVEPIIREVEYADDQYDVARNAEEIQVNLNEIDFFDEEEEIVQEMHNLIEKLSE